MSASIQRPMLTAFRVLASAMLSGGGTGHAESVRIVFDPAELSYGEVLRLFFSVVHDPTQLDRQGPDHGTQYRSNIFYANDMQRAIATRYIAQPEAARIFARPIVTRVDALKAFYPAEAHHQNFLERNPTYPYIVYNDLPKVRNLKKAFSGDVSRADDTQLRQTTGYRRLYPTRK